MLGTSPNVSLNVEYVFRIIYDAIFHSYIPFDVIRPYMIIVWQIVTVVGLLIALAALVVITYSILQTFDVRRREIALYAPFPVSNDDNTHKVNSRWQQVKNLMDSTSMSDWRQAIIEADIMLGEILTRQGYSGTSIGEQLKLVEPSGFNTLNDAWEAHKVRNEIAHSGSSFVLTDTLANRTISHYENVFNEFEIA